MHCTEVQKCKWYCQCLNFSFHTYFQESADSSGLFALLYVFECVDTGHYHYLQCDKLILEGFIYLFLFLG